MGSGLDPSRLALGRAKGDELRGHVTTWFSAEPATGMVNDLRLNPVVEAAEAEKPMNYVKNTMGGVFNAGFSTTFASIGSITYLLLSRPDLLDRLAHSPDKGAAVNELLRYTSPAQATSRIAIEDVVISGQLVEAGATHRQRWRTLPGIYRQPPDYLDLMVAEARSGRLLPGEGVALIPELLEVLKETTRISVEIPSARLRGSASAASYLRTLREAVSKYLEAMPRSDSPMNADTL